MRHPSVFSRLSAVVVIIFLDGIIGSLLGSSRIRGSIVQARRAQYASQPAFASTDQLPCNTSSSVLSSLNAEGIPKIVHQAFLADHSEIPENFKEWSDECRRLHMDYQWKIWSRDEVEEVIKTKYSWLWETWRSWGAQDWIKQSDALRYILLYEFGGVYMDLDYMCQKPVTDIITDSTITFHRAVLGKEHLGEYVDNSFMASEKGHWFWGNIFPELVARAREHVLKATGPIMLSDVLFAVCGSKPEPQDDRRNHTYYDPNIEQFGFAMLTDERRKGVIQHRSTGTWVHHPA